MDIFKTFCQIIQDFFNVFFDMSRASVEIYTEDVEKLLTKFKTNQSKVNFPIQTFLPNFMKGKRVR